MKKGNLCGAVLLSALLTAAAKDENSKRSSVIVKGRIQGVDSSSPEFQHSWWFSNELQELKAAELRLSKAQVSLSSLNSEVPVVFTLAAENGEFFLHDVPEGHDYVLRIVHPVFDYPKMTVKVNQRQQGQPLEGVNSKRIEIFTYSDFQGKGGGNARKDLRLKPTGFNDFMPGVQQWNPFKILKSPMGLMGLSALFFVFVMPKLQQSLEPPEEPAAAAAAAVVGGGGDSTATAIVNDGDEGFQSAFQKMALSVSKKKNNR